MKKLLLLLLLVGGSIYGQDTPVIRYAGSNYSILNLIQTAGVQATNLYSPTPENDIGGSITDESSRYGLNFTGLPSAGGRRVAVYRVVVIRGGTALFDGNDADPLADYNDGSRGFYLDGRSDGPWPVGGIGRESGDLVYIEGVVVNSASTVPFRSVHVIP